MTWPTRLAAIVGLLLLVLNVYPGVWVDLATAAVILPIAAVYFAVITVALWVPVAVLGVIVIGAIRTPKKIDPASKPIDDQLDGGPAGGPKERSLAPAAAVLGVCVVLCMLDVPLRVAFLASRPAFEACLADAPVARGPIGTELGRRLGAYHVLGYSADTRGGVYFVTLTRGDGYGPDRMFYGFVHRPNSEGTPYGVTRYVLSHVVGDWYAFEVSND